MPRGMLIQCNGYSNSFDRGLEKEKQGKEGDREALVKEVREIKTMF